MKKALVLTLVLTMILVGVQPVKTAESNFYPFGVPALQVRTPQSNPYISVEPTVNISFDYYVSKTLTQVEDFSYSLDESANSTLTSAMSDYTYDTAKYSDYSVTMTLENLANGNHSVTFFTQFLNGTIRDIWHLTIIVDITYKNPVPLMISPLNQTTYNNKEVPLVFVVNSTYVGDSLYRLDSSSGQNSSWQVLIGNGTLSNLSEGPHTLELITWIGTQTDYGDVEYRETVYFNVDTTTPTSTYSPAPTQPTEQELILGIAITVAVLGAGLGLLIYLIKRK